MSQDLLHDHVGLRPIDVDGETCKVPIETIPLAIVDAEPTRVRRVGPSALPRTDPTEQRVGPRSQIDDSGLRFQERQAARVFDDASGRTDHASGSHSQRGDQCGRLGPMELFDVDGRRQSLRFDITDITARVISIDYRMAPEYPYPAAVDDVVTVYRHLLTQRPARSMAMGGSSAGGGITLSAIQQLIELGVDVPAALFIGTPGSDLSGTGDTFHTNEGVDRNIPTYDGIIEAAVRLYAGELELTDPRVSPIYGSFDGFPPTLLVSGTRDLFLSNTVRAHTKLRQAGAKADLLVYEGVSHADYLAESRAPESEHFLAELDRFFTRHLRFSSRPVAEMVARMRSALDLGLGSTRSA